MRLIVDGNSLLNASLLRGVDPDEGRVVQVDGKDVQVNGWLYGVEGFFDKLVESIRKFNVAPRDIICTWDGRSSKVRRRTFLERYKEGRDKAPEVSEQLNIARDKVTQRLLDLGAHVAWQDGMEADDVIGYLCKHLRDATVRTEDGDLCVLVDHARNNHVFRLGEMDKNPYGPFPHKFITLYKALVGDPSDKIPGAKGFGDKKFVDLVATFGIEGLQAFEDLILNDELPKLREDLADFPALKYILDDQNGVKVSWRVASLMVDDVNTKDRPLTLKPGMVKCWDELSPDDRVDELREFYGTKTLVHAGNYAAAKRRFGEIVMDSPFVSMDIETSTGEESDQWIERLMSVSEKSSSEKVDVLGSELTGMGLTFGNNTQHTIYMTVDHKETDKVKNITVDQCRELCELIPHKRMHTVIQNRSFEFPVLYQTWGQEWKNNGWHGMWPNAIDTLQGASYTDENLPLGLKERSLHHLGYKQQTYDEVTTVDGVKYKMRELTAEHVFGYGADDPICTAALHTHYQLVMEVEGTWQVYLDVEQKPEYLTSMAFVRGVPVSLETMGVMERRDDERYDAAWKTLRGYLLAHGWDGTVCPEFTEIDAAAVKEAVAICVEGGEDFSTRSRKRESLAKDLREQFPDNVIAGLIAVATEQDDVATLNDLVKRNFTGEPKINFNSPKQVSRLFYGAIGMTPRIQNKLTDNERKDPVKKAAFDKLRKKKMGKSVEFSPAEWEAIVAKSSTDDTAVDIALKMDTHLDDAARDALNALKVIKTVQTRRSLYYKQYKVLPHWKDGRIHPNANQSRAVTRRYSYNAPNAQQLPKRGEGVEFRKVVLPHKKGAVVVAPDFSGQELRLMAEQSGDAPLTSCYIGENLRHPHVLLAVEAAPIMWEKSALTNAIQSMLESGGVQQVASEAAMLYDAIQAMRKLPKGDPMHEMAKKLYEDSKTTNFATQYDAQAERVSHEMLCDVETAQKFIDAKEKAFPGITPWKDDVRRRVDACGYAVTMLGARRHLREQLTSENRWEADKAGRQGPNFYIQSSAAEMTKLAMSRVWDSGVFADGRYDAWFYFAVHDELVYSVAGEHAAPVIQIVHACMTERYADMKIPVVSEISLGRTYGEQLECGSEFDAEVIRAAVTKALGTVAANDDRARAAA